MAKNKTTETLGVVADFINAIQDDIKRNDCWRLIELLETQTGLEPKMWGASIVGFGSHHYKYESGREGDSPNIAFSPRASSIALYVSANFRDREILLEQLGKHKTEKGCVHIKKLADIDLKVLKLIVEHHIRHIQELYPS